MNEERKQLYLNLIQKLLSCPNGQEPEVLNEHIDLIDADLITTMMQVATMFSHQNNPDGAKFLIFIARELSKQLGLYPETTTPEASA